MSEERLGPHDTSTQGSDAGLPVNHAGQQPTEAELDDRNRAMARPRRAAGPPLHDDVSGALAGAPPHEPPPTTDPMSEAMPSAPDASVNAGDAGLPVGHAGPKPSHDELDRRNRQMGAARRAAGPPLQDAAEAAIRDASLHEPPPATDPMES
jgi:hypothetical protein